MAEQIEITKLKTHPRNNEFFDNIEGNDWKKFLESIQTSGVIEPIIITQDYIIVSGHQRVRACKELKIEKIFFRMSIYEATDRWSKDDLILKELLETNLRQRGVGNTNIEKMGLCADELKRLYGVTHGGRRKSSGENTDLKKTQKEILDEIGI